MEPRREKSKRGISSRDPSPELAKTRGRCRRDKSPIIASGAGDKTDSRARAASDPAQSVASPGEVNRPAVSGPGSATGGPSLNGMIEKDLWRVKMEDPLEKQRIRERLRAMPSGKKDGEDKQRGRGPMVVRPPSPSVMSSSGSSGSKVAVTQRPRTLRTKRSPSPQQTPDSVFAQQVVCRSGSPTSPRIPRHRSRISPVNSRPPSPPFSSLKRSPSPQGEISIAIAEEILQKRVERALHARLYLLQQSGPNSFVIGGDSPNHKYKVIIGPQSCNCGKGPFCLHLLFVMLRVLQVAEGDSILWSRTLMNYELETLFRNYQARQKKRLKRSSSKATNQHERKSSHDASTAITATSSTTSTGTASLNSTSSSDQSNKEEDLCPICLLEMVDGESLVVCQDGCHNRLHHHCVAIWAAECERQSDPLNCPLCRTKWEVPPAEGSQAPPMTRKPSPAQSPRLMRRVSRQNSDVNELPPETQPWIEVFSEDLIRPLFSREWSQRENGFHHLRPAMRSKIQPREGAAYAPQDEAVIKSCCGVLALGCSDPVYKIYVAALKGLRTMLSSIQCYTEADRHLLREELKQVVEPILFKCADGNRRTSQLSISALVELSKGQAGELAVGREVSASDFIGLGGMDFIEECIFDSSLSFEPAWQSHLGRLCLLEKLMKEFPEEYVPAPDDGGGRDRLMRVLRFALTAARNGHSRICKLGKRVFVNVARSTVHAPLMYEKVCDSLLELEPDLQHGLRRRLTNILDEFEASRGVAEQLRETDMHVYGRVAPDDKEGPANEDKLVCSAGAAPGRSDQDSGPVVVISEGILTPPSTPPSRHPPRPKPAASRIPQLKQDRQSSNRPHLDFKSNDGRPGPNHVKPVLGGVDSSQATPTEDLSDLSLSMSPCSPTDRAITFKNEVTTASSSSSPSHVPGPGLSCKELIEMEEAEAIAIAMETSVTQNPLPIVPGLTPGKDEDVIVHIQSENGDTPRDKCYVERDQWVKGVLLGTGAFSSCYQSRDIRTGTLMAVKQVSFFRNTKYEQDKVVESLMREIGLMTELDHPNIVRLLGATRHNGHFNVFVEWMAGGSVSSVLSAYGAFEEAVVVNYTRQLLTGVAFLHSKHVIHRDLKGANLLLDSTGQHLRIADFGTAAQLASKVTAEGEFKGQLIGTIAFMSPEVLRGEPYGRACDAWSIGCCIVEMTTAHPPWNASAVSNHLQLIFKIASAEGPPPIPDDLSTPIRDLLLRCFEHKPANRETVADLLKHAVFTRL